MPALVTEPFAAAVDRLAGKTAVASKLRTKDWEGLDLSIRERALFSAGVDDLRTVQSFQDKLNEWATLGRDNPQRAFMDRSKFVAEMRQALGAPEGDTGDITDITSRRRLELIYDFQTQDAAEYGRWKIGQDPELLDAFPAQEFLRIESRRVPRENWPQRWREAGGRFYDGRMIALKNDPVWTKLSRFGRPWPPFDFGSGMGIEDVERDEAERLGVITPSQEPIAQDADFNKNLNADVSGLDDTLAGKLVEWFGDKVKVQGDVAEWQET